MNPTVGGFISFIQTVMKIPPTSLAPDDPTITYCFDAAVNIVNPLLAYALPIAPGSFPPYVVAVYNLAADFLMGYAQDLPNQTYFANYREKNGLNSFVGGVVSSSSDEATATGLAVPDWVKTLTIGDLQSLKTPWGRTYLNIAQQYGPTIWGLS